MSATLEPVSDASRRFKRVQRRELLRRTEFRRDRSPKICTLSGVRRHPHLRAVSPRRLEIQIALMRVRGRAARGRSYGVEHGVRAGLCMTLWSALTVHIEPETLSHDSATLGVGTQGAPRGVLAGYRYCLGNQWREVLMAKSSGERKSSRYSRSSFSSKISSADRAVTIRGKLAAREATVKASDGSEKATVVYVGAEVPAGSWRG